MLMMLQSRHEAESLQKHLQWIPKKIEQNIDLLQNAVGKVVV